MKDDRVLFVLYAANYVAPGPRAQSGNRGPRTTNDGHT